MHDELSSKLQSLQTDYERAQAVIKTLTSHSTQDIEYDNCMKTVTATQAENSLLRDELSVTTVEPVQMWLVIGIPTVSRNRVRYLTKTLEEIAKQLPLIRSDPLEGRLKIVVMNNNPRAHDDFDQSKILYEKSPWSDYFDFAVNDNRVLHTPKAALDLAKSSRDLARAGEKRLRNAEPKVQQQTRDVANLLRYVQDKFDPEYFMFMEDDVSLCTNGLEAIRYLIQRATIFHGFWMSVRASWGLNGIITQGGSDVLNIASYFDKHQARRPPDHLIVEWLAGETVETLEYKGDRPHFVFKYNIFEHHGKVSSLRAKPKQWNWPVCWTSLSSALFDVESFKIEDCPEDNIWPCVFNATCDEPYRNCLYKNTTEFITRPPPPLSFGMEVKD